jgi:hypothetical protein
LRFCSNASVYVRAGALRPHSDSLRLLAGILLPIEESLEFEVPAPGLLERSLFFGFNACLLKASRIRIALCSPDPIPDSANEKDNEDRDGSGGETFASRVSRSTLIATRSVPLMILVSMRRRPG